MRSAAAGLFFTALAAFWPAGPGRAGDSPPLQSRSPPPEAESQAPARQPLAIVAGSGARYEFRVELADDAAERARGLMFRERLDGDAGMLFHFPAEAPVAFWMKNTPLSLDILFIRADGRIARIAAHTTPFSLRPIPSGAPVTGVLEVVAGTAARLGLRPGDRVEHPIFTPAPDHLAPPGRSP